MERYCFMGQMKWIGGPNLAPGPKSDTHVVGCDFIGQTELRSLHTLYNLEKASMGGAIRQLFLQNYSEGRRRRWPLATDDASSHIWLTRTASATHLTALLKQNEQKRWPHWACSGLLNTFWQALHKCLISWLLPRIFLEKPGLLPSSEDGGDGSCAAIIPPPPRPAPPPLAPPPPLLRPPANNTVVVGGVCSKRQNETASNKTRSCVNVCRQQGILIASLLRRRRMLRCVAASLSAARETRCRGRCDDVKSGSVCSHFELPPLH